jgi:hypothetical protein
MNRGTVEGRGLPVVGGNPLFAAIERNYLGGKPLKIISTALLSFSASALMNRATADDIATASGPLSG